MPVYDFKCAACGREDEVIVLPPQQAPSSCEACGGALVRKWGRIGVQFVGWGFSKNDSMVPDSRHRKDFKTLRSKASELFD